MSESLSPEQSLELRRLVQLMHDKRITPEERARLEEWLESDEEARQVYIQYMYLYARVLWDHRQRACDSSGPCSSLGSSTSTTPVLGFLGDIFRAGANHLSRPFALTLLVTLFLPGIILLILLVDLSHQPSTRQPVAHAVKVPAPVSAAQFTRSHECVWTDDGAVWPLGTHMYPGQKLKLQEGLAELTFPDGAKLLLRGPATFQLNRGGGCLDIGSLTATVPQAASGFKIETPLATVVDLGTEFGVSVGVNGTSEAHVFKGRIQVITDVTSKCPTPLESQLVAGQGARIRVGDFDGQVNIQPLKASSVAFIRRFPDQKPKSPVRYSRLIASANRKGGMGYDGVFVNSLAIRPTITFDGETDPLLPNDSGLQVDSTLYSDRDYVVTQVDKPLIGADYVRMFNTDKENPNKRAVCTYDVTFATEEDHAFVMLLVDDRWDKEGKQQKLVDGIVSRFAKSGDFVDTGFNVEVIDHAKGRALSAYGMMLPTRDDSGKRITYTFVNKSLGFLTFVIAAMEKPPASEIAK